MKRANRVGRKSDKAIGKRERQEQNILKDENEKGGEEAGKGEADSCQRKKKEVN